MKRGREKGKQPQKKRTRRSNDEDDEDAYVFNEEEEEIQDGGDNQSQKQSQTVKQKYTLSDEEFESLVSSFMRYALFMDIKKLPIKRDEVNKLVLTDKHKKKKDLLQRVVEESAKRFQKIFGFDLIQIERRAPTQQELAAEKADKKKGRAAVKGATLWILRLSQPQDAAQIEEQTRSEELRDRSIEMQRDIDAPQSGLLMIILALLQTNNGVLSEEMLWSHLRMLTITRGSVHEKLGNVEKTIDLFCKQLYLERRRDEMADNDEEDASKRRIKYEYTYGTRLNKEMNKETVLRYLSETCGTPLTRATLAEQTGI